jgi:pyruvate dehydrogenase E1 component
MTTHSHEAIDQLADIRRSIADRVLWLSTAMVHRANNVRPNTDGMKVGGHQSSCASSIHILSSLFFETLGSDDRIAIKPHSSPVYHSIRYLFGDLDESYMDQFRAFGGLQAYPSRTKDPDDSDFSTGSVGLPGPAVAFAALTRDYLDSKNLTPTASRFFAHLGDAELDEGSIWEAVAEPALEGISRCVWVIDVNRQSLDRVVPGIRIERFRQMFEVNGWTAIVAKYGSQLTELMSRPGGHALRRRIDDMPNEEYQGLLVCDSSEVRERLISGTGSLQRDLERCLIDVGDDELQTRIANLGGHDFETLNSAYQEAAVAPGPAIIFAYTVKGYGLEAAADPRNHAALLTNEQFDMFANQLAMDPEQPWQRFDEESQEGQYAATAHARVSRPDTEASRGYEFVDTNLNAPDVTSTQDIFGRILVELDRTSPDSAQRIVTASADVATSTNLSSWINRVGLWSRSESEDYLGFQERVLKWIESPEGRHIELGISEMNLMIMLGQLGLAEEISGQRLIPIGTVYDPFVARGLDGLLHALYSGSRFMLVATPSGVSLSSEGGAHQGVITPSIGIATPGITYYEPAFARDLEWIMLHSLNAMGAGTGESTLLRLSTRPVNQSIFPSINSDSVREDAIAGCYRLRSADPTALARINIFAVGAIVPEAIDAVPLLAEEGIDTNIFVVTSPDLLNRRVVAATTREAAGTSDSYWNPTGLLHDHEVGLPTISVIDGAPSSMAFLGSALDCPTVNLGVSEYGQSGSLEDLYQHFALDAQSIYNSGLALIDRLHRRTS